MAEVILICGKVCSGKTTYSDKLKDNVDAVSLSCDELVLSVFPDGLGDNHDIVLKRVRAYLMKKASELVLRGQTVILDWGFWNRELRAEARNWFSSVGVAQNWHYINVSEEKHRENIEKRNSAVRAGQTLDYYVDDGLFQKCEELFEVPGKSEIDVWIEA